MLNKVILQGDVGRVPKITLTQEGKEIATFSLATTQSWKDTAGKRQSATDWHRVTVFRDSTIRWIKDSLRRGDRVYLEGKLSYHHWTDKHGQPRSTPHVVIAGKEGRLQHLRLRLSISDSSTAKSITAPLPSANLNSSMGALLDECQSQTIGSEEDIKGLSPFKGMIPLSRSSPLRGLEPFKGLDPFKERSLLKEVTLANTDSEDGVDDTTVLTKLFQAMAYPTSQYPLLDNSLNESSLSDRPLSTPHNKKEDHNYEN